MNHPQSIRNICVAGHLHHGKTLIMDMLIQETYQRKWDLEKNYRWLDSRVDEQEKLISIKGSPISLLLPDMKSKNYLLNFIDTPGHPNFIGEFCCALRVSDAVLLVVDVIEGLMLMTEKIIRLAVK
jgi:U5 small nuclear ribonucleoprotein component